MAEHIDLGNQGEDIAKNLLLKKGYEILECNWRNGRAEIDIIAKDKDVLVFVEVKTRRTRKFGHPEENVDRKKIQNLMNAAEEFNHYLLGFLDGLFR